MKYDLIVLGAGINGSGVAREASLQNKSTLLIDKSTVGCGTSSRSSRLIHGGLRYLEYMEFKLVYESLHDRNLLCRMYPKLVRMTPFYFPVYKKAFRPAWKVRLGLRLYDILSNAKFNSSKIPLEEFYKDFPAMRSDNITAVFQYYDARTDDLKLTQQVAREAVKNGAKLMERTKVISIEVGDEIVVKVGKKEFITNHLVNATGPWANETADKFNIPINYAINKVSGIHIELKKKIVPNPLFLMTKTKRMFFIIPEEKTTLIGTTERKETVPCDKVRVNPEDIDYLIRSANHYLQKPISRKDIKSSFIGIRPLFHKKAATRKEAKSGLAKQMVGASRDYKFDLIEQGKSKILHVLGGKLTTYMTLAKKALKKMEDG